MQGGKNYHAQPLARDPPLHENGWRKRLVCVARKLLLGDDLRQWWAARLLGCKAALAQPASRNRGGESDVLRRGRVRVRGSREADLHCNVRGTDGHDQVGACAVELDL